MRARRRHCRNMGQARMERAVREARRWMPSFAHGSTLAQVLCLWAALRKKVNTLPERFRRTHENPTNLHIWLRRGLPWAPQWFSLEKE